MQTFCSAASALLAAPQPTQSSPRHSGPRKPFPSAPISSSNLYACSPGAALAESPDCGQRRLRSITAARRDRQPLADRQLVVTQKLVAAILILIPHFAIFLASIPDTRPAIEPIGPLQPMPAPCHSRNPDQYASIRLLRRTHRRTSSCLWLAHFAAMQSCAATPTAAHPPSSLAAGSRRCGAAELTGIRALGGRQRSQGGCR